MHKLRLSPLSSAPIEHEVFQTFIFLYFDSYELKVSKVLNHSLSGVSVSVAAGSSGNSSPENSNPSTIRRRLSSTSLLSSESHLPTVNPGLGFFVPQFLFCFSKFV